MDDAGDIVSNLPAIMLLSFWWAFLSTLDLIFRPGGFTESDADAAPPRADETAPADPRLRELLAFDPHFDTGAFLSGARRAYEEIVRHYASGDIEMLRPLLSADVLAVFAQACAARVQSGETLELTFIGIDEAEIVAARVTAQSIELEVRFRAEIVSALLARSGAVIEGDTSTVILTDERWTFARAPADDETRWTVIATDQG
ncbi:MAG: Tim44 domain-containing protein [Rhizobiaceae bacterium]|nr:Tim44 domain-containing protein [Rhizobiaceae bacterium]